MFEHRSAPLLPFGQFLSRFLKSVGLFAFLVVAALGIGVLGYHALGGLPWIDSVLNASMILAGMGPVNELHSNGAKLFASAYALFSGVVFISSIGVVGAPVVHRFLHRFHVDTEGQSED